MAIHSVRVRNQCFGLNNLSIPRLLEPKITKHIRRRFHKLGSLIVLALLNQFFNDKHGGLFHWDIDISRERIFVEQLFQCVFLGCLKRGRRRKKGDKQILHLLVCEETQLLHFAPLPCIYEIRSFKRRTTEWATIVSFDGECVLWYEMPARKIRPFDARIFTAK